MQFCHSITAACTSRVRCMVTYHNTTCRLSHIIYEYYSAVRCLSASSHSKQPQLQTRSTLPCRFPNLVFVTHLSTKLDDHNPATYSGRQSSFFLPLNYYPASQQVPRYDMWLTFGQPDKGVTILNPSTKRATACLLSLVL